ncbi:MAG: hypothetical protein GX495_18110 [Chloroflexi bacterium]|nr:hypothetical protein [Chloroflexota bacterium]
MNRKFALLVIPVLMIFTLACRFTVDLPIRTIETGPTQTEEIEVPAPDAEEVDLIFSFGAGELNLSPGAGAALVSGTVRFNVEQLAPVIKEDNDSVRISSGNNGFNGIPRLRSELVNEWDLQLGSTPVNLEVRAGAYRGEYDLGGLALRSLIITDGASDVDLDFSEPNQVEMRTFRYQTGASNVDMTGLANANFERMVFESGAGDYSLYFSGELQRDATIDIDSGISQVTIIIPEGTRAEVRHRGGLVNIDADPEWEQSGDEYILEGDGPTLTFNIDMSAGDLQLRVR